MSLNVLVPGMTEAQHRLLADLEASRDVTFHPLLDYERLVAAEDIDIEKLLADAREEIRTFDHGIDGIIPHWDFPTSVIVPILAAELGLRAPTLESVLRCEHKYWSRIDQRASIPDVVPDFELVDPFDDEAVHNLSLDYPFWLKPVKSHSSSLGFRIGSDEELRNALAKIREDIGDIGDAFNVVLDKVSPLPPEVRDAAGSKCIAEVLLTGHEFAIEGCVSGGEVLVHGTFDMGIEKETHSLDSFVYPAEHTPDEVQERAISAARDFLTHVGFNDGCFNAEFIWNKEADKVCCVEVNTRISQSHTALFMKVDGAPNHLVALDVALGRKPEFPHHKGTCGVAAMCYLTTTERGIVTKVPTSGEIYAISETFPETIVELGVHPGDVLEHIAHQDPYRYRLGTLTIGAETARQLQGVYEACVSQLLFEIKNPSDEEKTDGTHHEFSARDQVEGE
ncbi:ATP-grasp domain-containing protein [Hoyosella altamirensis]|uniref:Biotin carboxylase n=1 Tax=Hoyosella altamirensis TaxID=616997 RepID=A0A839RQI9_9ACTN|nr:ATP-grasp domain-containing protein [Hoyosella altamirensis]MBB3038800.1 biotin carboxylase [Hoyosella altamirensis]